MSSAHSVSHTCYGMTVITFHHGELWTSIFKVSANKWLRKSLIMPDIFWFLFLHKATHRTKTQSPTCHCESMLVKNMAGIKSAFDKQQQWKPHFFFTPPANKQVFVLFIHCWQSLFYILFSNLLRKCFINISELQYKVIY